MNDLVRNAHRELDDEVHRLAAAYQQSVTEAMLTYERGVMDAQARFETRLHTAVGQMTDALMKATGI